MNNRSLNFFHEIPLEVYHSSDTVTVEISINNHIVYNQEYSAGKVHHDVVSFYYEYADAEKNCLVVNFRGNTDALKKYIKIKSVAINQTWLNLYNADYKPTLNSTWWNSLTDKEKTKQQEIIYGKRGNTFGWFGEILFDFGTGVDNRSRFMLNNNIDSILSKKLDWIFLDNIDANKWDLKSNDKLL